MTEPNPSFPKSAGALLAVLLLALTPPLAADDWPQWRGPDRDGHADAFGTVEAWPAQPEIRWRIDAGTGQASPLVAGNRVLLFDRVESSERLAAIDLASGEVLWQHRDPIKFKAGLGGGRFGPGPKATPVVAGDTVITYGVTSVLTARRLDTGQLLWRQDLNDPDKVTLHWGNSMSPIVVDEQVVVQYGNDRNGGIRSYDLGTGELRWQLDGHGSSYASPILVGEGDSRHLALMTWEGALGLSLQGEILWTRPLKMSFSRQNVSTPIWSEGLFIFSGEDRPMHSERIRRVGDSWSLSRVWQQDAVPIELTSPVAFDGRVCGITIRKKGQFFCLSLASGEELFRGPERSGDYAVLLVAPEDLLLLYEDGRLVILDRHATDYEPTVEYRDIARTAIWTYPAIVPGGMIVKSEDELLRLAFDG